MRLIHPVSLSNLAGRAYRIVKWPDIRQTETGYPAHR